MWCLEVNGIEKHCFGDNVTEATVEAFHCPTPPSSPPGTEGRATGRGMSADVEQVVDIHLRLAAVLRSGLEMPMIVFRSGETILTIAVPAR